MTVQLLTPRERRRRTPVVQRTVRQAQPPAQPGRPVMRSYQADAVRRSQSVDRLTLTTHASPIGTNYFDRCGDEIMSLHYGGALPLLDWMGFQVTNEAYKVLEFIAYVRPEMSDGSPTAGYLTNACADPNGIEFGTTKLSVENFGRLGRTGPTRDIMKPQRFCATDPVYRLDGSRVTSEREWDIRFAVDTLLGDTRKMLITGNSAVSGQFDGLQGWVKTGYTGANASMLDSTVIDWNGNPMTGGSGITWNGNAVGSTFDFLQVFIPAVRNIKTRIMWARQLQNQQIRLGGMIILLPTFAAEGLLDFYSLWSFGKGASNNPMNLQQTEVRQFRNSLVSATNPANLFGYGYITIDNFDIPLLAYDWELIKGPKTFDMYFLTGGIGNTRIWEGEHLSADVAASNYGDKGYMSRDGGRILYLSETDNECSTTKIWMHPRLFCRAPWAQIRVQNVQLDVPGGPLSADPLESSFYPNSSFTPAVIS